MSSTNYSCYSCLDPRCEVCYPLKPIPRPIFLGLLGIFILSMCFTLVAHCQPHHPSAPPEALPDCSFVTGESASNIAKANEWAKALGSKPLQCHADFVRDAYAYLANAALCKPSTQPSGDRYIEMNHTTGCPNPDVLQWFWDQGFDFPRLAIWHLYYVQRPKEFKGYHSFVYSFNFPSVEIEDDACTNCEVWVYKYMIHGPEPQWSWATYPPRVK